jgi:hypothetical protein
MRQLWNVAHMRKQEMRIKSNYRMSIEKTIREVGYRHKFEVNIKTGLRAIKCEAVNQTGQDGI